MQIKCDKDCQNNWTDIFQWFKKSVGINFVVYNSSLRRSPYFVTRLPAKCEWRLTISSTDNMLSYGEKNKRRSRSFIATKNGQVNMIS